ncbi:hypothetical protein BVY03_01040, partial [bacterium K02(2017)]
ETLCKCESKCDKDTEKWKSSIQQCIPDPPQMTEVEVYEIEIQATGADEAEERAAEVIAAFKLSKVGFIKDELDNTITWNKIVLKLTPGLYVFTDDMADGKSWVIDDNDRQIDLMGGPDVHFTRKEGSATPFGFLKSSGTIININGIKFTNWGGDNFNQRGVVIFNLGSIMTVENSVFSNNSSIGDLMDNDYTGAGGAIANQHELIVRYSGFYNNTVISAGPDGCGGAIWSETGYALIENSVFAYNEVIGMASFDGTNRTNGSAVCLSRNTGAIYLNYVTAAFNRASGPKSDEVPDGIPLSGGAFSSLPGDQSYMDDNFSDMLAGRVGNFYITNSVGWKNHGGTFDLTNGLINFKSEGNNIIDDASGEIYLNQTGDVNG